MHRGYIKLWRRLKDQDFWLKEKFTRGQAWVDLIMLANHKEGFIRKRGIRVSLTRGDVGWSERELAKRWRWSRGKVRRFLFELCSENESKMEQQNEPQNKNITSCYKIKNYNQYQGNDTTEQATDGPQTGHRRYQNKNVKNVNNIYTSNFLHFWSIYPKKIGKGAAFKSWQKIKKSNGLIEKINEAVLLQTKSDQWKRDNGQYIPNPATWLNQRRWEDEPNFCPKRDKNKIIDQSTVDDLYANPE